MSVDWTGVDSEIITLKYAVSQGAAKLWLLLSPGNDWALIVSGFLMTVGSFMPWWQRVVFSPLVVTTQNGFQLGHNSSFSAFGLWTLLGGVAVVGVGIAGLVRRRPAPWLSLPPAVLGFLGLVAVISSRQTSGYTPWTNEFGPPSSAITESIQLGLWVVLAGSIMAMLTGVICSWSSWRRMTQR